MKTLIKSIKDYCTHNYESIAVAENVTSGCLQMLLGNVPNPNDYFQGGITAMGNENLSSLLGVQALNCTNKTDLNLSLTIDMAKAVAKKFNSDIGIAINGCNSHDGKFNPSFAAIVRFNKVIYAEKLLPRAQASSAVPIEYAQRVINILAEKLMPKEEEFACTTAEIFEPLS